MRQHLTLSKIRIAITVIVLIFISTQITPNHNIREYPTESYPTFDAERAFRHLLKQQTFGPRTPNSDGIRLLRDYITSFTKQTDCQLEVQEFTRYGNDYQNIICKKGNKAAPFIIVGAHYDTREYADRDPDEINRNLPVPGANDGASGVAVLLELSTIIDEDVSGKIWFVFFDGEDNGEINGKDWILGSRYFAHSLKSEEDLPDAVLILDMIGDNDLNIYYERNSDINIMQDLWSIADAMGYSDSFVAQYKYSIVDDHLPFVQLGVPSVDVIDFDYPYWHTTHDTIDKVSADSLKVVGDVVLTWLLDQVDTEGN